MSRKTLYQMNHTSISFRSCSFSCFCKPFSIENAPVCLAVASFFLVIATTKTHKYDTAIKRDHQNLTIMSFSFNVSPQRTVVAGYRTNFRGVTVAADYRESVTVQMSSC